jgi:hydrogenase maturation protease
LGPAPRVTVLGLGNTLLSDEGVGVHVVTSLQARVGQVAGLEMIDGGTLGMHLLAVVEESTHLIVVDALRSGVPPGTVTVLEGEEALAWESAAFTAHDFALPSVLAMARLRGWAPQAVAVVGIEPLSFAVGLSLTPDVQQAVAVAAGRVLDLLRRWGRPVTAKPAG